MLAPRDMLEQAARTRGASLAALSRLLGRNPAYLQQYVRRGSPRVLPERERGVLADYLGIDERALGAPERGGRAVPVPRLDVRASAGPGALVGQERALAPAMLGEAVLRAAGIASEHASVITVSGESMAPTLLDGDQLLIDGAERCPGAGIFVVRLGEELLVKRLRRERAGWLLVSDNPHHAPRHAEPDELTVIGRARLLMRDL